ncbi:MAG: family 2 glycosyl transferase [Desulfovibrionaceae bacterium CG1_02_65_16]|nr:MAG: family 2 glycosyl transferase [Desulfovibrionaceae bacterium CG1_02_65_16]
MPTPELSIIIPAYNSAPWLPYAIESCLWQSQPNIEAVIVDDGSTDATPQIVDAYAKADPRVRVLHQPNKGAGVARQAGQELARGRYLLWLDADDFLDRHAARDMIGVADRDHVDMVCGNAVVFSDKTFNSRRYFHHPAVARTTFENPRYWKSKVAWRWIVSRAFVNAAHITHPPLKLGQDVVVMYDLLCRVGTFSQCPSFFYYFRQEHKGMDSSLETEIEHELVHYAYVRDILVRAGRPKPLVKYLSENYLRDIKHYMPRILGREPHWERRVLEISRELFSGVDPTWLARDFCEPEVRHNPELERLGLVLRAGDEDAIRAELAQYGAPGAQHHHAPNKANAWHTFRRRIKAMLAPLSLKARARQSALRARAAKRLRGVWTPE